MVFERLAKVNLGEKDMKKHPLGILLIILLVATLTQISTDMYIPSLPGIAHHFHVSVGASQATMSLFILGVAITGLIFGYLSEIIGRRSTIVIGILIGIVGALICLFAPSIGILQLGRFVQGCGLGACSALWRSIFRDTYSGDELARVGSYLANFVLVSVVLAPFIGGYIEQYTSWRVTFIVLSAWSVIVLGMVVFLFKETGRHHGKHRAGLKFMLKTYGELIRCRHFMGFTFCSFLSYGGLFAWLTSGPVVLIKGAGISPVLFGWLSIITGAAMAAGGMVNGKLVKRVGSRNMMQRGWGIMVVAGILMAGGYYLWGIDVYTVLIPAVVFIFGSTLTFANAFSNAFANIGHIAGYGGGLYSTIQLIGGAVFSAILSHLSTTNQLPMAWLFVASAMLSWVVYKAVVPKIAQKPPF